MREVKINGVYKHFKGDYYIVEDIAKDSDTLISYVVYRGLYGDTPLWIRELSDFLDEVNKEKYPNALQKYKFELQEINSKRTN